MYEKPSPSPSEKQKSTERIRGFRQGQERVDPGQSKRSSLSGTIIDTDDSHLPPARKEVPRREVRRTRRLRGTSDGPYREVEYISSLNL